MKITLSEERQLAGLYGDDEWTVLRQQTVLAKFGELALKSNDLDEILTKACTLVGEGLGTDLAKVMELREHGTILLVRAGVGWKPGIVGELTLQATGNTSESHALKTGQPMISPDIGTETRFSYPQFLVDNGVRAVANVVILGGEGKPPFGILQVDSRTPRRFTDDNVLFLRGYANLIAAAVDRFRVIEEMRQGAERLRLALDAGALGTWELDLRSGVASSTRRTLQIFGYAEPPPLWNSDTFIGHVSPEYRAHVATTFREAIASGAEWWFECPIAVADDSEIRWISARGRAVATPATHLLAIVTDITLAKAAEALLRHSNESLEQRVVERSRELVEANDKLKAEALQRGRIEEALRQSSKMEAVGQLTGGIAHDFNNLLAGISGSLEMIQTRVAQGRHADLDRYIRMAAASTGRAAALTKRLLAFARRQTLDPKPTDVNQLVGGMTDLFRRTVGPSVHVEPRLEHGLWPVSCDSNQLESALLNLVINARDAMPSGGHVLIETENTTLSERRNAPGNNAAANVPPGDYVALIVTDTGVGMPADILARAFDPFFTTKPLGQGTGLGLSMIFGFVQQSGGHVLLRSEVGKSTTVTIYLPRHLGAVDAHEDETAPAFAAPSAVKAVILVVEDESPVRTILVDLLSDIGYTVLEAGDGRSGLSVLESSGYVDLLLSDVGLPGGMNGRELADAARQRRPDLKVLFMTGYAHGTALADSPGTPGMHVMTKPFTLDALAGRVHAILNDIEHPALTMRPQRGSAGAGQGDFIPS